MKLIITDLEHFPIPVTRAHKLIQPPAQGKYVIHDSYENTGIDMGKCTELILVSRCCYGSVSPFVKAVLDRAISYIHPDFVLSGGEMHHKRRYRNVISLSACFYGESVTASEKETARNIIAANAVNYDGQVKNICFYPTAKELENIVL